MARNLSFVFLALGLSSSALGASYSRTTSVSGNFLDAFNVQSIPDPTTGRVNYVDQQTAQDKGLVYTDPNTNHFVMRPDSWTVLDPNGPGRDSVRLLSKDEWTEFVGVVNIHHMPEGCGTWPAFWTVGTDWPNNGEIDILEGVNDRGPNQITLHTASGCTVPQNRDMTGTTQETNCDANIDNNVGCGVEQVEADSYGPAFNQGDGGWFVTERATDHINVWFWARSDPSVPDAVRNGAESIDTSTLGKPTANYPNNSCDINGHFGPQRFVINLTFCGVWAGATYGQDGCPGDCVDRVNNQPNAFSNSYFNFESFNVYTPA